MRFVTNERQELAAATAAARMTRPAAESRSLRRLRDVVTAGHPLLYVRSTEDSGSASCCARGASFFLRPGCLWTWSLTEGMTRDDGATADALAPAAALDFIAAHPRGRFFTSRTFTSHARCGGDPACGCATSTRSAAMPRSSS